MSANRKTTRWMHFFTFVLAILLVSISEQTGAQDRIELRCGEANLSTYSKAIPGFGGAYYYIAAWGQEDQDVRAMGRITATGEQLIPVPLPLDVAISVGSPFMSPDGSKIAFTPFSIRSHNLLIWDRITNETATFELTQELADYLSDHDDTPDLAVTHFNTLIWRNQSELAIQYFGLYPDVSNPVLRIPLTVLDRPLRIVAQTDVSNIDLETLPASAPSPQSVITSPDGAYRLEVQERGQGLYTRQFQVYDARTNQVVLEVQSSEAARVVGNPMWSSDRNHIFYVERVPSGTKLVQLNANERFQRDTRLDTLLQNEFGSSTGVASTFLPILSRDGTHLGFGYLNQSTNEYYMIRYNPRSGEVIAVCDDFPISSDWYPFWSPSNRFAGYWYNGVVKIYDFETGNRYRLPGKGFAGWISEIP